MKEISKTHGDPEASRRKAGQHPRPDGLISAMMRFGRIEELDRSFDIEFWQRQGDAAIFVRPGSWSSLTAAIEA